MRLWSGLGTAIVLVVLGAACGGDDNVTAGSVGATSTSSITVAPDTPVEGPSTGDDEPGRPERVEPRPGMASVIPVSFEPSEAVPTDNVVVIPFYGGVAPCFVLDRVEVDETDARVAVSLFAGSDPTEPDAICIEIAKRYEVAVALRAPLGGRALVDGST